MKIYQILNVLFMMAAIFLFLSCPPKQEPVTPPAPPIPEPQPEPIPEPPDPNINNPFIYIQNNRFFFQGKEFPFKGVNYYPVQQCWRKMWMDWRSEPIQKELDLLQSLGVNTVRVFLDYNEFEKQRERVGENSIMLARLDELLLYLSQRNQKALITLFVWGRSGKIDKDQAHLAHIIKRFKDDPRIFGWDISNELDHGWANKPSARTEIQSWATKIFMYLKSIDPNHIATVGDFGHYLGDRSDWQGNGISFDDSKMSVPAGLQDFICFHWYGHPAALDIALQKLTPLGKPIIIEEIGMPTGGITEDKKPWPLTESQVGDYYRAWIMAAWKKAYIMPWCGYDYDPAYAPFPANSTELYFGLFAKDYRLKSPGEAFRDNYIVAGGALGATPIKLAPLPKFQRLRIEEK